MIPLVRFFLLIFWFCAFVRAQSLDEAVRQIARNVLSPGEISHVSERALSPEFAAETARAKALLDRALARPAVRDARMVEVVVTATVNNSGPLLVVQIQKGEERFVKTAAYSVQPVARAPKQSLTMSLLWRQDEPILDLAIAGDRMLVLSPQQVEEFQRAADGKWEAIDAASLESLPRSRDPRGKLFLSADTATAFLPGGTCEGKWLPSLQWNCAGTTGDFQLESEQLHFTAGENTLETSGGEALLSIARSGDARLTAGLDGNVHASNGQAPSTILDWGSDIASLTSRCLPNPVILSTSAGSAESLTAYEISGSAPRRITDALPVQGWVTALWPAIGGVLAVVHETVTGRYAAYLVSLDCGS
jgi:hypothetical protein